MRLHRGSSKDVRGDPPTAEILPLSASPPAVVVDVEVARSGRSRHVRLEVVRGTLVRDVVRKAGETPEGCAVLLGDTPVPLDAPVEEAVRLTVVPTFSGG
jgi:sulfur carrier protein ThiS